MTGVIPRQRGSIRRTSHIDMHLRGGELSLAGEARDLITTSAASVTSDEARLDAHVDAHGCLSDLTIDPDATPTAALLGQPVAAGFRRAVRDAFPEDVAAGTPLALLLDDLPVATLISGYARLYRGELQTDRARTSLAADICSGWRSDGTMMVSVRAGAGVPVTVGPPAPLIADQVRADPNGWHMLPELADGSMRRRRLIDVTVAADLWQVSAMFRDTHVEPGGPETVLHEYALTASIDATDRTFVTCAAIPRVLPWVECPVAAASADQLVGQRVEDVRAFVHREMRGTTTCTHLNDLLRSLGDVGLLADRLTEQDLST